ncbi:MAG: hypothetical protein AAF499_01185 [Pseudomonadota bacterium]
MLTAFAAALPSLAFAVCEPTFENLPRSLARTWTPIPQHLPGVGEDTLWQHPSDESGHALHVHHVTNKRALRDAGMSPESLNTRHEYSQHSAFSATGRWLISHGIKQRILFDGLEYKPKRVIRHAGKLHDWYWDPLNDDIAFYISKTENAVMRYDVNSDSHTPVFSAEHLAAALGIENAAQFKLEGSYGQGGLSSDGNRLVTKFARGADAHVVVFNPHSSELIAHEQFPGMAGVRKMDWQVMSPSGDWVLILGEFDPIYGTQFAVGRGVKQVRAFRVEGLRKDSSRLISGRPAHLDLMRTESGQELVVFAGAQSPNGWEGLSTQPRGLVQGLYTVHIDGTNWRKRIDFRHHFEVGQPAAHVSASPEDARVLLSFYQGGNPDDVADAQNTPLLLVDLSDSADTQTAWLGWDLAANPGIGDSSRGYLAQPHASFSPNVTFASGDRGIKVVWASDNNQRNLAVGNMVVAEVVCPS